MAKSRSRAGIDVENLDEILRKLDGKHLFGNPMEDMYKELGAKVRKTLAQTTEQLAYRTGDLAGGYEPFELYKSGDGGQIDNPVFYGRFIDRGTAMGIKPRRFVRKAATKSRPDAQAGLRKLVGKIEQKWRI